MSDDTASSSFGDRGAESKLASKKKAVLHKRQRDETALIAGSSPQGKSTRAQPSKGKPSKAQAGRGRKAAKKQPTPALKEAPLDIPPLNFRMPPFGS